MIKITVAIITYNEEKNIVRCIDSVKDVADEILVVDSFSTDATKEISLSKGAKVIQNEFKGHIEQKNYALDQAKYDHVLSLDADESLSKDAIEEVIRIKRSDDFHAYVFNRLTNYCGKWIKHCGWYPDKKLRFVNRKTARWGGENPHDRMIANPDISVKHLNADILHYAIPSIASHAQRANTFSSIAAQQAIEKNASVYLLIHVVLNPLFTFVKKYFFQLGFLDGFYGFVISILSAHSNFLKYSKIWQLKNENSRIPNR